MRKKGTEKVSVDAGFEFGTDIVEDTENEQFGEKNELSKQAELESTNTKEEEITTSPENEAATESETETKRERTYSKYYKPHPKVGAKGGTIGKPPVKEKERKRSVSIQLSNTQKERYNQAAAKDRRKWPDFVVAAIEEYIEKHNLE